MFSSIKKWIMSKGVASVVPTLVRFALGALAGWLAAQGYSEAATVVTQSIPGAIETVSAVAVALFAVIWSLADKASTVPTTSKAEAIEKGVEYAVLPKEPKVVAK